MSGRSDIYTYFFTHAAHLLKPGGYLGFVTSVGWLDTDYGFKLQEFFLRNFRIVAVIESQVEKWFEDARVTTAVTILQREEDSAKRNANSVRFIQLRRPLADIYTEALDRPLSDEGEADRQADMDAVRDLIEEIGANQTTGYWRVHVRTQRDLWKEGVAPPVEDAKPGDQVSPYGGGKWGQYLRAPDSWFELLERARKHMTPLRDLAIVKFGFKTGADRFFCVRDVTRQHLDSTPDPVPFLDRWGITREDTRRIRIIRDGAGVEHLVEARFLEPELHSLMEVKRNVVRKADVGRKVINASISRARLRNTRFANYVAHAEREGWHTGSTIAARARTRPWYNLGLLPKAKRAEMFWPKAQQYRHVVPLNQDRLVCKDRLYDVWAKSPVNHKLLWACLNSTVVALSKHQFGRAAGIEGNLDTHVIDVNAMLVPDVRNTSKETATRAIAACERMSERDAERYLYDEFTLADRRELDDATLEILGIEDPAERTAIRDRLYLDVTDLQKAIREREIIAQHSKSGKGGTPSPQHIADELWSEHAASLDLLQFPEDFVTRSSEGDIFDLPSGQVEFGTALTPFADLLEAGTIRVGGTHGEVIDVGSVARGRFIWALSLCHRAGRIRLPEDNQCQDAVDSFEQYHQDLQDRCSNLARQTTSNQSRQRTITAALLRKALQWRRP